MLLLPGKAKIERASKWPTERKVHELSYMTKGISKGKVVRKPTFNMLVPIRFGTSILALAGASAFVSRLRRCFLVLHTSI